MGCGIEPRKVRYRRGREFHSLEGNMCGTAMRGADALPGSKATSRAKGSHRILGDVGIRRRYVAGVQACGRPNREGEEPKPMMHGDEKSDLAIVAVKPANKAKKSTAEASAGEVAAEPVERRLRRACDETHVPTATCS